MSEIKPLLFALTSLSLVGVGGSTMYPVVTFAETVESEPVDPAETESIADDGLLNDVAVPEQEEADEEMNTTSTEESFSYTQVILPNIEKGELVATEELSQDINLKTMSLDPDVRTEFINQLYEQIEDYRLDEVDWADKFNLVRGRYANAHTKEVVAGAGSDVLYVDKNAVTLGELAGTADEFSVVLFDTSHRPLFTYNYATDTFTDAEGDEIYANVDREYVYTPGVYVNSQGDVLTVTDIAVYHNGKLRYQVDGVNIRPVEDTKAEGEWLTEGGNIPFVFQEGKLQTSDSVWFLIL